MAIKTETTDGIEARRGSGTDTAGNDVSTTRGGGGGTTRGGGGGSGLERVTVNLTARSVEALEGLVTLTEDTKTDAINKALQVYAYLQNLMKTGGALYVRDADGAELERVRFL